MAKIDLRILGAVAGVALLLRLINNGGTDAVVLAGVFWVALALIVVVLLARGLSRKTVA